MVKALQMKIGQDLVERVAVSNTLRDQVYLKLQSG
jgi:hypothetical protein